MSIDLSHSCWNQGERGVHASPKTTVCNWGVVLPNFIYRYRRSRHSDSEEQCSQLKIVVIMIVQGIGVEFQHAMLCAGNDT